MWAPSPSSSYGTSRHRISRFDHGCGPAAIAVGAIALRGQLGFDGHRGLRDVAEYAEVDRAVCAERIRVEVDLNDLAWARSAP
jgi:hypothetical protein